MEHISKSLNKKLASKTTAKTEELKKIKEVIYKETGIKTHVKIFNNKLTIYVKSSVEASEVNLNKQRIVSNPEIAKLNLSKTNITIN